MASSLYSSASTYCRVLNLQCVFWKILVWRKWNFPSSAKNCILKWHEEEKASTVKTNKINLVKSHSCWEQGQVQKMAWTMRNEGVKKPKHPAFMEWNEAGWCRQALLKRETASFWRASGFSANVTSFISALICQVCLQCVERSAICVYKALYRLGWRTARNRHPCSSFSNYLHLLWLYLCIHFFFFCFFLSLFHFTLLGKILSTLPSFQTNGFLP